MTSILKQCDREKAINELVRGQSFAKRLKTRLQGWESPSTTTTVLEPPSQEAGDAVIIKQLMACFENTLCIVKSNGNSGSGHKEERRRNCQEYSGSSSSSSTTGSTKDRRGCYKRVRKTDDSWIQESSVPVEDGYRWRKYGQKTILHSKYLRDYFRCTHKDEQGCLANKHVQRVSENPALYRTTYFGHHTCTDLLTASQFLPQEEEYHTAPFSIINFTPKSGSNDRGSSSNNTWSSFFTPSQSSTQEGYNNTNNDLDLPSHNHRQISTYNNSPSFSHYLLPTYDHQKDVSGTTTTPIMKCYDFDENCNFIFYW